MNYQVHYWSLRRSDSHRSSKLRRRRMSQASALWGDTPRRPIRGRLPPMGMIPTFTTLNAAQGLTIIAGALRTCARGAFAIHATARQSRQAPKSIHGCASSVSPPIGLCPCGGRVGCVFSLWGCLSCCCCLCFGCCSVLFWLGSGLRVFVGVFGSGLSLWFFGLPCRRGCCLCCVVSSPLLSSVVVVGLLLRVFGRLLLGLLLFSLVFLGSCFWCWFCLLCCRRFGSCGLRCSRSSVFCRVVRGLGLVVGLLASVWSSVRGRSVLRVRWLVRVFFGCRVLPPLVAECCFAVFWGFGVSNCAERKFFGWWRIVRGGRISPEFGRLELASKLITISSRVCLQVR